MLIEITGCTCTGKTKFSAQLREALGRAQVEATSSVELAMRSMGFKWVSNPTMQNIISDILALGSFIFCIKKYAPFYRFACAILFRHPDSYLGALNRLRSLNRKIGIHEFLLSRRSKGVIIVDEGTVHSAHNIFAYAGFPIRNEDIRKFAQLVPLPDIVVCLDAAPDVILSRSGSRRELPTRFEPAANMPRYIARALQVFQGICGEERIKNRLISFNNDGSTPNAADNIIAGMITQIKNAKN